MRIFCLFIFIAMSFTACAEDHSGHEGHASGKQMQGGQITTYRIVGSVENVNLENQTARIKHGDIKGFMRGMTMDFSIRDADALASLSAGDQVEFWLETGNEKPVIVELKKLP